jgi:hypothetical protein
LDAEIRLVYKDSREAKAVARAVAPDNVEVPSGLKIETVQRGNQVLTRIECETRFQTFMATIDDLLEGISVAENTFKAAKSQS